MACCFFAKYYLLFFNLIIWLSGGAFLSAGIYLIMKKNLHSLFAVMSQESRLILPLEHVGYFLIGFGGFIFLVGLIGCCGSVRESRCLLGLYVLLIIVIMGGELIVAMYTVLLSHEWSTQFPHSMKRRLLSYNYSVSTEFEEQIDAIHRYLYCCGIEGPSDFFNHVEYKNRDRRLPLSCCEQKFNEVCYENDAYRFGCYQVANEQIHFYSIRIVIVGIAIASFELIALLLAVCTCRNTLYDQEFY